MFEVICITFAFFFGLGVRQLGLPPLVGFLAAGFAINYCSPWLGLPEGSGEILKHIAHLGVLLLLFAIGLKLKLSQIIQPQVLGGAFIHFGITTTVFTLGIRFFMELDWNTSLLLGIALAFSSTVLAAKILESKGDLGAFYGRTAIGILIVQDLIALAVLGVWGDLTPTIWALAVFALPLLRPALHWLLNFTGHDELLVLLGMLLALVVGGMGFESVGLSSEIGALVMGFMLSTHKRASELSDSIWSLKEVFLVGFFLQIGMSGLPNLESMIFALVFAVILPLKGILFFYLMILFGLKARNSFLTAFSLTAYSEFGLIVAAGVLSEWLVPLALAVAFSFLIAAPLNAVGQSVYERLENRLQRLELACTHPDELPINLSDTRILILGMGRIGTAAYDCLKPACDRITGLDSDTYKVAAHRNAGRNVRFADVEDAGFWRSVDLSNLNAVILAMDGIEAKVSSARALRLKQFNCPIVTHTLFEECVPQLLDAGATHAYLTMQQAGKSLAEHTAREIGLVLTHSEPETD